MIETEFKEHLKESELFNQFNLLFKIYKLKKGRELLSSKLNAIEKLLNSGHNSNVLYKFEALKVVITENDNSYKNLTAELIDEYNVFDLIKRLEENILYLENLDRERKKKHIDSESYEITKGYYLQKLIDTKDNLRQLKKQTLLYYQELKVKLITFEDQRIILATEKERKKLTKEEYKVELKKIEKFKQEIEEQLAFLKVKIIDYDLEL
ncbi:hypothetical protein ES705_38065 [subsurface metagenome]